MAASTPILNYSLAAPLAALLLAAQVQPALACSTCGCSLNSDWSTQGYAPGAGVRLDLRYDYFDQKRLYHDTSRASPSASDYANSAASGQEYQQDTRNHVVNATLDYSPNADWGVSLLLPYIDRHHTTVQPGDPAPPDGVSSSQSSGIGDVRLLGRYQGFGTEHDFGILFGVKLPTGAKDTNFTGGPASLLAAPNNGLDRGLQLGSGTTDLLLGFYKVGALSHDWDYFLQALALEPLNSSSGFRPSDSLNVNIGARFMAWGELRPQLQLNARLEGRESADPANSGGTQVFLSPGLSYSVSERVDVYGFASVPVFVHANGYQLVQPFSVSVGAHYSF
jgi:hypothetical protein